LKTIINAEMTQVIEEKESFPSVLSQYKYVKHFVAWVSSGSDLA
jgi:hypothetical protein